jgi:uncharacterized protein YndB with AHSA1/START domain
MMEITHELTINASAKTIFDAVSTAKGISGWWSADCTVGMNVGSESVLKFNKEGMVVTMGFKTLDVKPNSRVEWECIAMPNPAWIGTKVITEIEENGGSAKVVFKHADFDEKWKEQEAFEQTKATWNHFMASLVSYCESGVGQPW